MKGKGFMVFVRRTIWNTALDVDGIRTGCHASQSQDAHQALSPLAVDRMAFGGQMLYHFTAAVERVTGIFSVM